MLFLAAAPVNSQPLALTREFEDIRDELRIRCPGRFLIEPRFHVKPTDLPRLVMEHQPQVLHFSGHGQSNGELVFEDADGYASSTNAQAIARVFELLPGSVRCVLLNACYSEAQARLIAEHVDVVIGMSDQIRDTDARPFAKGFYEGLSFGKSVGEAFELAKLGIWLNGSDGHDVPRLHARAGVHPQRLWLKEVRSTEIIDFTTERKRHGNFFGREDIFAEIEAQLKARPSGWIVITAGPGMGKSGLLERWLTRREEQGLWTAYHFVRRGHQNWADPAAIRANLAAQIEAMFPEARDTQVDPRDRLEKLLAKVRVTERIVLLVDGLDEAMRIGKENPVPEIFPTEVPERVFVVVASRPRYPFLNWFKQRTGAVHEIDLDSRSESNTVAVRKYWEAFAPRMDPPLTAELRAAAIVNAQGNLLHAVKLYERWTKPGVIRSVEDVPKGSRAHSRGCGTGLVSCPKNKRSSRVTGCRSFAQLGSRFHST
jgi:hypothetical protein